MQEFSITGVGTPEQVDALRDAALKIMSTDPVKGTSTTIEVGCDATQQQAEAEVEQEALNDVGTPGVSLREQCFEVNDMTIDYANQYPHSGYDAIVDKCNALNLRFADEIEAIQSQIEIITQLLDGIVNVMIAQKERG